jgi:hypothetical protein
MVPDPEANGPSQVVLAVRCAMLMPFSSRRLDAGAIRFRKTLPTVLPSQVVKN